MILENAKEIMFLCIGGGVLAVCVSLSRALGEVVKAVKKINTIIETLERVLWKPLQIIKQIDAVLSRFL